MKVVDRRVGLLDVVVVLVNKFGETCPLKRVLFASDGIKLIPKCDISHRHRVRRVWRHGSWFTYLSVLHPYMRWLPRFFVQPVYLFESRQELFEKNHSVVKTRAVSTIETGPNDHLSKNQVLVERKKTGKNNRYESVCSGLWWTRWPFERWKQQIKPVSKFT